MNIYFIFPRFRISINGSNKIGLANVEGQFFEVKFIWKLDSVFNVHFTIASITWLTFFECGTFTPKSTIGEMNYSTTFSVKWSDSDFKVNECCKVVFSFFNTVDIYDYFWKNSKDEKFLFNMNHFTKLFLVQICTKKMKKKQKINQTCEDHNSCIKGKDQKVYTITDTSDGSQIRFSHSKMNIIRSWRNTYFTILFYNCDFWINW